MFDAFIGCECSFLRDGVVLDDAVKALKGAGGFVDLLATGFIRVHWR
jgi:hypothetical protein